jgi:hypothetical protein
MALFTKTIVLSELSQIDNVIETITGSSEASIGLIESSIEDLNNQNEVIDAELKTVRHLSLQLSQREKALSDVKKANEDFIGRMKNALKKGE